MRIQIRSFVMGGNHGQYLQALGLRSAVMRLRPDAEVTHLRYNNHVRKELNIQRRGGHLLKYLSMRWFWARNFGFSPFDWEHDLSIYGSDMIWHLESPLFPADKVFFGERDGSPRIAYAPSVGFRGTEEPDWVAAYLSEFRWIGARDETTVRFVEDHTRTRPTFVIDPCFFLLDTPRAAAWKPDRNRRGLVVYSAQPGISFPALAEQIGLANLRRRFGRERHLGYHPKSRLPSARRYLPQARDPLRVLDEIANAELLLTSTFHGVMMALMTGTPFVALRSRSLDARLQSPIAATFGQHRLIDPKGLQHITLGTLEDLCGTDDLQPQTLAAYREKSMQHLAEAIEENLRPTTAEH
jgi:hypothetical protein